MVGAGASGIGAATRLLSHGFTNVTVLEGQNRIGGRINTVPFGDSFIDLGAQWCHGQENNAVYDLVKDKDLLEHSGDEYYSFKLIRSNGEVVSDEVTKKLKEITKKIEEEGPTKINSYDGSLGAYNREQFLTALNEEKFFSIATDLALEFLNVFERMLESLEGSQNIYDDSGKGILNYAESPGDQNMNWKGQGYVTILNILMESKCRDFGILHDKILLNKEVSKINFKDSEPRLKVETLDGLSFEADHVIFTGSVGVLRERIDTLFEPKLPNSKYLAANNLGFGTVNKIWIRFDEPWWDADFTGFTLQWMRKDLEELRASENSWLEDVFGFFTVSHQPDVLLGWVVGKGALEVESIDKVKQLEGVMYLFRRFIKNKSIPQPIDFMVTAWKSNKFARGSYSHRSMDTERVNTSAADLAEPILSHDQKPILMFAGEATHSFHYSTVHGAIESGRREADRIYEYYCK